MSFQQGLSGLNGASKTLETIGNNIANSNTVGFKSSQAQFADVYASSLSGAGASQVGIGTKVSTVTQQFTQGNITASNNPLDIAINGNGFFGVRDGSGAINFSRNGQFQQDANGYIITSSGARLQGYAADINGVVQAAATPTDLRIDVNDSIAPKVTDSIAMGLNLDAGATVPVTSPFDPTKSDSYNNATSVTVYDLKGTPHVVQTYFVKTAAGWDVWTQDDIPVPPVPPATTPAPAPPVNIGTLVFDNKGNLTTVQPMATQVSVTPDSTDPTSNFKIDLDFTKTTNYGAPFSVNTQKATGYSAGRLTGFNISSDGTILGRYSNGEAKTLGQVVLYTFKNPNGLQPLGNNVWAASAASSNPVVNTPGNGGAGVLQSSAVEDSNVDMTAELVNMITAQRVYQANAQTIKTQDQVLQTLVNLR